MDHLWKSRKSRVGPVVKEFLRKGLVEVKGDKEDKGRRRWKISRYHREDRGVRRKSPIGSVYVKV